MRLTTSSSVHFRSVTPAFIAGVVNAGAIRVLIPRAMRRVIQDMRTARYVIASRGPWPEAGRPDALELLFEDGSDWKNVWSVTAVIRLLAGTRLPGPAPGGGFPNRKEPNDVELPTRV